ncbi:MAG TPA: hypothetical protein VG096_15195 [Bryobacteraceae bacterium]|jgi:hypothetical protein|nr:hypothetical protein [Bryobacteraceae bacterium]
MPETPQPIPVAEERYALYYPYIHIRSENWLKSTLLAFQQVQRIVPYKFTLRDQENTAAYATLEGPAGLLLTEAPIYTPRVKKAQDDLRKKLETMPAEIRQRFTHDQTPSQFQEGDQSFQIHRMKILDAAFAQWLVDEKLAWNSRDLVEADASLWLTMHPRLGAAIMSMLALPVARQHGLHIVTPSHRAHMALLASKEDQVFEQLLEAPSHDEVGEDGESVSAEELSQLLLTTTFDLTSLKPTDIRDVLINGEKELRDFHDALGSFAQRIPSGLGAEERKRRMKKEASAILERWHEGAGKLPQLKESLTDAAFEKAPEKLVDAALKGAEVAAGATLFGTVIGAVPGIILSIVVTAGARMFRKKDTPLRFLNRVDKIVDKRIGSLYVPQWRKLAA